MWPQSQQPWPPGEVLPIPPQDPRAMEARSEMLQRTVHPQVCPQAIHPQQVPGAAPCIGVAANGFELHPHHQPALQPENLAMQLPMQQPPMRPQPLPQGAMHQILQAQVPPAQPATAQLVQSCQEEGRLVHELQQRVHMLELQNHQLVMQQRHHHMMQQELRVLEEQHFQHRQQHSIEQDRHRRQKAEQEWLDEQEMSGLLPPPLEEKEKQKEKEKEKEQEQAEPDESTSLEFKLLKQLLSGDGDAKVIDEGGDKKKQDEADGPAPGHSDVLERLLHGRSATALPSSPGKAKSAAPAADLAAGRGSEAKKFRTRISVKILQGPSPNEGIVGELAAGEEIELLLHATHSSEDGVAFVPVQRSPSFGWATLDACRGDGSGTNYIFMRPLDTADCAAGGAGGGRGHVGAEWEVLTECCIRASVDASSGILCRLPPGAVVVQTGDAVTMDGLVRLPIKPKEDGLPIVSGWCAASTLVCSGSEDQTQGGCNKQAPELPQWPNENWQAAPPTHVAPVGQLVAPIVQQAQNEFHNVQVQDCMTQPRKPPLPPGPHPSTRQYQEAAEAQNCFSQRDAGTPQKETRIPSKSKGVRVKNVALERRRPADAVEDTPSSEVASNANNKSSDDTGGGHDVLEVHGEDANLGRRGAASQGDAKPVLTNGAGSSSSSPPFATVHAAGDLVVALGDAQQLGRRDAPCGSMRLSNSIDQCTGADAGAGATGGTSSESSGILKWKPFAEAWEQEMLDLLFTQLDTSGRGVVGLDETRALYLRCGMNEFPSEAMFRNFQGDHGLDRLAFERLIRESQEHVGATIEQIFDSCGCSWSLQLVAV